MPSLTMSSSAQLTYRGLTGYLTTITTEQEQNFVASLLPSGPFWFFIGGSDSTQEGVWRWVAGPENGTLLSSGYTKWSPTEPNGGTSENDLIINDLASFGWADITSTQVLPVNSVTKGYIVEYGGMPASYSITPSASSVNEGNSVTFTINTKNIEWGKTITYSISGISQADLSSGSLNGTAVVNQNGVYGQATVTIGLLADQLTEGAENLTINVSGTTSSVVINDTSRASLTYSLDSDKTTVDEGSSVTFTLST
jgi:trimeric autotransporter adhesin